MDNNLKAVKDKVVQRTIENLEKNNMRGYHAKDKTEIESILKNILHNDDVVGIGGSMTLFETGVIDFLRKSKYDLLDRYVEGLTKSDIEELYRKAFFSDAYFTSTNAITEKGELYNVDGIGNRVAAMIWGPKKVIVVCGTNKIVRDEQSAIMRVREIAAPANVNRLSMNTPCAKLGYCVDCSSPDRICSSYVTIKKQRIKERIHVILVDGGYGY